MRHTHTGSGITRAQVAGVTLGNALEFYDFLVFAFFAVQIGRTFFPATSPGAGLLAALATFGAGFLTRPLGAVVLGIMGDRAGRRPAMLVSFAMIGGASLGVALVPGYHRIGWAAPALVITLRLLQGFALGGEVGASSAFLAEAAAPERRGFLVSLQFVGQNGATLVAGLVGTALASALTEVELAAWGWRVALGLGVLIVPVGLRLRRSLPETLADGAAATPAPPVSAYRRVAVVGFLTLLANTICTYVSNYMTTYAATSLALPPRTAFGATVAVGLGGVAGALAGGLLSDRAGRRPLMLWPQAAACLLVLPGFWLIGAYPGAGSLWGVSFALRLAVATAATAAFVHVTEALPPRVRSGALAVLYAVAISVFGGSTQFVVAWLTHATGDPLAPAWYMLAAAVLGLGAMLAAQETAPVKGKA